MMATSRKTKVNSEISGTKRYQSENTDLSCTHAVRVNYSIFKCLLSLDNKTYKYEHNLLKCASAGKCSDCIIITCVLYYLLICSVTASVRN